METLPTGGGGGIVVSQPGTIDYVQQYQQTVLGEHPINWGNVIVVVMILALLLGGGAFVYWNERRRRGLKGFFSSKAVQTPAKGIVPVVEGYSSEVTELLPLIAKLNPVGLHALKRILANPDQANEMLHALSHLDPELVKRVQALDKDSRAYADGIGRQLIHSLSKIDIWRSYETNQSIYFPRYVVALPSGHPAGYRWLWYSLACQHPAGCFRRI